MSTILKSIYITFFLLFVGSLNAPVYSQEKTKCIIGEIRFEKNNKTRRSTIMREIEFAESDTILVENIPLLFEKAAKNLMNTLLFNFVTITPFLNADSTILDVEIAVVEKWYLWPIPLLEIADRNFNSWWKDKDLSRLNYGFFLNWDNFTGRKDMFKLLLRFGHEDKLGFYYSLPSFNKKQNLGFNIGISYAQKHEIGVETVDNNLIYYRDEDEYIKESLSLSFRLIYRQKIHHQQYLKIDYQSVSLVDTLISLYPSLTPNNYKQIRFLTLSYKYVADYRDYTPYPLVGSYFDIELNKIGFGLVQSKSVDFFYVQAKLNYYWKLKDRWFYASSVFAKISNGKFQPYVLQRGLGYMNDFIRAYELYIMDGQHYGLFRSNLKYELVPKRVHDFKFIKNEKFGKVFYALYLNMYFDMGYVKDRYNGDINPLVNELQYGYGLGLDLVTYYDIVYRVEYSRNKQNEGFLFFHVKAPF